MKLLVAGNLVNHGYYLVKLLRDSGIQADLFLQKNPKENDDPKKFDKDLKEYPEWIKFWDYSNRNWKIQVIKTMRKYDLIQASTELPMFAMMSLKPFISFATGSDLIELAHEKNLKGFLLRQAYKKSKVIVFPGLYMYPSIRKLKIKNAIFLPLLWDYEKFSPKNQKTTQQGEIIIFHPTRHDWNVKGNDKLMRAYVRLAQQRNDVHLTTIYHGIDAEKSFKILKNGNIEGRYTILPRRLTQNELQEYYQKVDVVADYFFLGSFGLIGQEAMACEKPLINYIDTELFIKFYGEIPPILNARTEDQICDALNKLADDKSLRKKIGIDSRKWLIKHHDIRKIVKKYVRLYECVNNKIKFEKISDELGQILID